MAKKYYWLKLQKDFFKRHDIRIIEEMPNGKDYILFYMKLLVESISHDGSLRFSETIPYNENMLSTVTNTNIDIVRSAVKLFGELGLMDLMEDGTLYMNEVQTMMGVETDWAEKKRLYRDNKQQLGQKRTLSDKSKSLELDKEIEIEIDKDVELKEHFESVWKLFPTKMKKGKGSILKSLTKLKFISSMTLNTWKTLIDRYNLSVKDKDYLMQGSTFFNTGYFDFLDDNYEEIEQEEVKTYKTYEEERYYKSLEMFNKGDKSQKDIIWIEEKKRDMDRSLEKLNNPQEDRF